MFSTFTQNSHFLFRSSETIRIYFGFRVNYLHSGMNYLHSGVNWPIAIDFVIENVNILELESKLVNTRSLNIAKKKIHAPNANVFCFRVMVM